MFLYQVAQKNKNLLSYLTDQPCASQKRVQAEHNPAAAGGGGGGEAAVAGLFALFAPNQVQTGGEKGWLCLIEEMLGHQQDQLGAEPSVLPPWERVDPH